MTYSSKCTYFSYRFRVLTTRSSRRANGICEMIHRLRRSASRTQLGKCVTVSLTITLNNTQTPLTASSNMAEISWPKNVSLWTIVTDSYAAEKRTCDTCGWRPFHWFTLPRSFFRLLLRTRNNNYQVSSKWACWTMQEMTEHGKWTHAAATYVRSYFLRILARHVVHDNGLIDHVNNDIARCAFCLSNFAFS
jgi:hypothetical protein